MTPYIGQIMLVGFNFAPYGWLTCDGSTLQIAENDALYALIGTTYGGNGQTTFNLPDLRGRITVHQGPGYVIGMPAGSENVTLIGANLPIHTHPLLANASTGGQNNPASAVLAGSGQTSIYSNQAPTDGLNAGMISPVGGNLPHANIQPFLACNWIIAQFGIFPPRS